MSKIIKFCLQNVSCAGCVSSIEGSLGGLPDVETVSVNFPQIIKFYTVVIAGLIVE